MRKLVIADTSCLIALSKIGRLELLQQLFTEIVITEEIKEEYGEDLMEWIQVQQVKNKKHQQILALDLDKGEASAIALGMENKNSLLLIDERKGRKVATDLGLSILGTLGVLVKAKEKYLSTLE